MKKLTILIALFFPVIVYSQTTIQEGDVSGTWTLSGSPYLIEGDITIVDTDTLTIEPGVTVEFQDYYGLFVEGYLRAIGHVTDSILFTVNDTTGYHNHSYTGWKGIKISYASENDSSYLKYCIIEYGKGVDKYGGGLYISNSSNLSVTNSVIQNCYIYGGDSYGGGIAIISSNSFLREVVIQNNYTSDMGGGLFISNLTLDARRITITNNNARNEGGGLYSVYGSENLYDFIITGNTAGAGGGVWSNSNLHLHNSEIYNNSSDYVGGGIYLEGNTEIENTSIHNNNSENGGGIYVKSDSDDNSQIVDCHIYNNNAGSKGGGICIPSSYYTLLKNTIIDSNYSKRGGGIYIERSTIKFEGLSIRNNNAQYGGAIYFGSSYPSSFTMDSVNLCSIYSNNGNVGKDFYTFSPSVEIIVDTFTVQNPSDYYAIPASNFSFNITNGLSTCVNEDFYISPDGSDQNSGLNITDPFKTIDHALSVLYTDDQNTATLFISDGVYSLSNTGEIYPLTVLSNLKIQGSSNTILDADSTDRILYSYNANSQTFNNLTLQNGSTEDYGGGIYLQNSSAQLDSINVLNCKARLGGGIHINDSPVVITNIVLKYNTAELVGGGLYVYEWDNHSIIDNAIISENSANKGGGICTSGFPEFKNITVTNNFALESGGGIYNSYNAPVFDTTYRSNIYFNSAPNGNDLYNNSDSIMHVIVDTFTVMHPTSFHAKPLNLFDFDILHGKIEQISNNVYISVEGDNSNSGLTWNEPLKTIRHGMVRALSSESTPITMHLASGFYSEATNEETFPIRPIDYFNLIGYDQVIIDADSLSRVIDIDGLQNLKLENLQLQNGFAEIGGGINIEDSEVELDELIVTNNTSTNQAGGINIDNSLVTLSDLVLKNNESLQFTGAIRIVESLVDITNSIIDSNHANGAGGIVASFSDLNIIGSQITNNFDESFTGGLALYYTTANIINTTFSDNKTDEYWSGAILAYDSVDLDVINCVFWDDANEWDIFAIGDDYPTYLTISNSSLTEGENSIGTQGDVVLKYGATNIFGNPEFLGYGTYPYQLDEFSPCINMGSLDTVGWNLQPLDIAGNPRIYNGVIDMGAYEWNPTVNVENNELDEEILDVSIYPNPTKNNLTISSKNNSMINEISIYNQLGQKVLHKKDIANSIDVSLLQQGIYIIEIITNELKFREKLIVR